MFGALYAAEGSVGRVPPSGPAGGETLAEVAREFSPRIEVYSAREITFDLSGLARLFGDARTMAGELRRTAADRGVRVRVAIAGTRAAARLLVRARAGITIVEPGTEAAALAPLPLSLLEAVAQDATSVPNDLLQTLRRWGLRTLGDVAALPPADVASRLGQEGVEWQRLARGEDPRPLIPSVPEERFEQALDLEWPIEGLEPLSFVLGRLLEPLSAHLERRGRGAAVLHVRLHLVMPVEGRTIHERSLQLPIPMRDARALRTLALLDLESHPPAAAIDRVVVAVDPTPGRVVQFSLLTRPLPSPEQVSTLLARLTALMGEGRCGSPAPADTWQPGAFAMKPFAPRDSNVDHTKYDTPRLRGTEHVNPRCELPDLSASVPRCVVNVNGASNPVVALRRFRIPVPARVRVEAGTPVRVTSDRRGLGGGRVERSAGPWRTSGGWWVERQAGEADAHPSRTVSWDRDEWDVALSDGATYRVFRARDTGAWFLDGVVD